MSGHIKHQQVTILVFLLQLLYSNGISSESCTKFSSVPSWEKSVAAVNGVCYYGIKVAETWTTAATRCARVGTHLVHLQTTAKQNDVYMALGPDFGQHWTGLRYLNNEWRWYYDNNTSVSAESDVIGRFQGSDVGDSAYTLTSNQIVLRTAGLDWSYKPVCEDSGFGTESTDSDSATTSTTTTASPILAVPDSATPPAALTTTSPSSGSVGTTPQSSFQGTTGYFYKQTSLSGVQMLTSHSNVVTRIACADRCMKTSGCRHFLFRPSTKTCGMFADGGLISLDIGDDEDLKCYSRV